jgi:hypothetical protein
MVLFANIPRANFNVSFRRKRSAACLNDLPSIVECTDQDLNRLRVKIPIRPERADEFEHCSAGSHPRH